MRNKSPRKESAKATLSRVKRKWRSRVYVSLPVRADAAGGGDEEEDEGDPKEDDDEDDANDDGYSERASSHLFSW